MQAVSPALICAAGMEIAELISSAHVMIIMVWGFPMTVVTVLKGSVPMNWHGSILLIKMGAAINTLNVLDKAFVTVNPDNASALLGLRERHVLDLYALTLALGMEDVQTLRI
mmetsp:Transcript_15176/g.15310  ORF Transcript_15176/g.15310 Transcript_15176/m.15310 type:complete len:112 (+) Transcript_15176:119-454(+)